MKFAYLILAHHNFLQLQLLLDLLDDERNDIYAHLDKKIRDIVILGLVKSKLYYIEKRASVTWENVSQIRAEYNLFRADFNNKPYDYYHLISKDTMPIKINDYIQDFFEKNRGNKFVGYGRAAPERCTKYHLFTQYFRHKIWIIREFFHLMRNAFEPIINLFPKKIPIGIEFKKGAQWINITNECLRLILDKEDCGLSFFKRTYCCDNVFVQTII
ncbi:beta-1,6-N-acetylglucosaminyltransferase [Akkermansia sp. N21116]|jgi:hypothetical protein|uniref:beta-1,6-N-acetylglucosaminyltransferase n=1 Tax=Akkermansia sp. N21116 TaxID=3040764 RepID=UPI00244EB836|nr:beta-1,6-N-acetylglucosaminyltransferase [Akkermansia sp. N21116]WPX41442.1 beta-1,6-N-acetylglucosaminyltransferase [Akkermansia sp. N21116]